MRPTGSTARRGRGSTARSAGSPGGARRSPPGSPCSGGSAATADPEFVDWLAIERVEGREYDVAIHRHWLDPTRPLAGAVLAPGRWRAGDLRDLARRRRAGPAAEARTGAVHLPRARRALRSRQPVRLWRPAREVLIVTDVKPGDLAALAGAYARLIEAAGGGTLGLFTAIQRLEGGPCADRRPSGARRAAAARPARRPDRRRHAGRYFPRRPARLAARHRRAARRGRRARQIAAAGGDGARAVAAPDGAPRGAADGGRRQRL